MLLLLLMTVKLLLSCYLQFESKIEAKNAASVAASSDDHNTDDTADDNTAAELVMLTITTARA